MRSKSVTWERGQVMGQNYTAVIKQDEGWWIGWIEEVPGVNCQERTREVLIESLRITLVEALDLNRQEARGAAGENFEETPIAV
jgi:predicted RNase H-like HicB family nuclease